MMIPERLSQWFGNAGVSARYPLSTIPHGLLLCHAHTDSPKCVRTQITYTHSHALTSKLNRTKTAIRKRAKMTPHSDLSLSLSIFVCLCLCLCLRTRQHKPNPQSTSSHSQLRTRTPKRHLPTKKSSPAHFASFRSNLKTLIHANQAIMQREQFTQQPFVQRAQSISEHMRDTEDCRTVDNKRQRARAPLSLNALRVACTYKHRIDTPLVVHIYTSLCGWNCFRAAAATTAAPATALVRT